MRILRAQSQYGTETDGIDTRELLASMIPAGIALFVGLGIAFVADSNALRLLGLGAAAIPFLLLRIPTLKRALLALALLEIVFPIDIYVNHDIDPDELGVIATINPDHVNAITGFNVSVTSFCLVALYFFWFAERLAGRTADDQSLKAVRPALVYVLAIVASLGVAQSTSLALYELTIVFQALLLLVYLVHFVNTRADVWLVVGALTLGLTLQTLLVLAQAVTGTTIEFGPLGTSAVGDRVAGTLGSPNALGSYLSLLAPAAFGLAVSRIRSRLRILGGAAFVLATLSLFFALSRGALLGFAVAMVIMAVVTYQREWMPRRVLVAGFALFAIIGSAVFGASIVERITTGSTLEGRLDLIEIAIAMISDHPLLGVGANNFAASIGPYIVEEFSASWISTVHNKYLLVWAETGLLALVPFLWLLIAALIRAWTTSRVTDRALSPMVLGLGAGVLANMIHMSAELYHSRQQTQVIWVVVGLIIAISHVGRRAEVGHDSNTLRIEENADDSRSEEGLWRG